MSGLNIALQSSANTLRSYERALEAIQRNVGNISTPGYARQEVFSPENGLGSESQSSRSPFAEQAVRRQSSALGQYDRLTGILSQIEPIFSATGESGIPKAIGNLFGTFSALTANPNDTQARQAVIDRAGQLAGSFNQAAAGIQNELAEARTGILQSVDSINRLAGIVRDLNEGTAGGNTVAGDPALDAKLHATLEELSKFAGVQILPQTDGSTTVLLGQQTPLVVGKNQYQIRADVGSGPLARILDAQGADITSQINGGQLQGSLTATNQKIPAIQADLNLLASRLADAVNTTLAAGVDSNGNPGAALFSYNSAVGAAASLAVTSLGVDQVAAAASGAPGGNGNALALSALASSAQIGGFTFAGFYGKISSQVGRELSSARENQDTQTQLLAQARSLRDELSGVSLDQEAARLVEFQRAYQATAKLVTVLDQLSQTTIDMIR